MVSELGSYVRQQQEAGYSNEHIRNQLRDAGWTEEQMAIAFNEVETFREDRKWTTYSIASIIAIFVFSLSIVGFANVTGFAPASKISCIVEDPNYPGNFDFVESETDCLRIALANVCNPVKERVALEIGSKVVFESNSVCEGKYSNLYFQ